MVIVRSLDVGFGSTKFVTGHAPGGGIQCRIFPSIAPLASGVDITGGVLSSRDTVVVEVDHKRYEVGPQVEVALKTHHARVLHAEYTGTPEYLALARGAFHCMNVPHIDLLVVGLPVAQLVSKRETLEQRMVGVHPLPGNRMLSVRRAVAIAQPIGGFVAYAAQAGIYDRAQQQVNLVIDPGFFTFDWVLAKGLMPISHRSGSFNGGVSAVLKRIADAIGRAHGIVYDDLAAIDNGLRLGGFSLYGRDEPLERYLPDAVPVIEEAVTAMSNTLGDGRDIHNIVLVGGGARLFRAAITRRFPNHTVRILDEAVFANVRGYQHVGEQLARKSMENAA